jgi:hypothetical protein
MYTRDKYRHCGKCKRKTKWVRCPGGCNGRGNTSFTQCGNNCDSGYKCENGKYDKWHS